MKHFFWGVIFFKCFLIELIRSISLPTASKHASFAAEAPKVLWKSDQPPRKDHSCPKWLTATEFEDQPEAGLGGVKTPKSFGCFFGMIRYTMKSTIFQKASRNVGKMGNFDPYREVKMFCFSDLSDLRSCSFHSLAGHDRQGERLGSAHADVTKDGGLHRRRRGVDLICMAG